MNNRIEFTFNKKIYTGVIVEQDEKSKTYKVKIDKKEDTDPDYIVAIIESYRVLKKYLFDN